MTEVFVPLVLADRGEVNPSKGAQKQQVFALDFWCLFLIASFWVLELNKQELNSDVVFAHHLRMQEATPGPGWESLRTPPTAETSCPTPSRRLNAPTAIQTWRKSHLCRARLCYGLHLTPEPCDRTTSAWLYYYCCSAGPCLNSPSTVPSTCPAQTWWVKVQIRQLRNFSFRTALFFTLGKMRLEAKK